MLFKSICLLVAFTFLVQTRAIVAIFSTLSGGGADSHQQCDIALALFSLRLPLLQCDQLYWNFPARCADIEGKLSEVSGAVFILICLALRSSLSTKTDFRKTFCFVCVCVVQQSYDILLLILMVLLLVQAILTSATVVHCASYKSQLRMGLPECEDNIHASKHYCEVRQKKKSCNQIHNLVFFFPSLPF